MATEAANMNGMYDAQYGQPAELAASTPSHAPSASQSSTTPSSQQKADPQEIGWYFVEQYYTTLSKSPEKIYLFYSKKSQLVTGVEAEKVLPVVGTKAIHEKIKSLDIQDCKVRVLNVDSQLSYENIVVQVIGEMSNKSEPHHKFVQTFILATQPNGYFVLNDIFRYLNEDEDETVADEPTKEEAPVAEITAPTETEPETKEIEDNGVTEADIEAEDENVEKAESVKEEPVVSEAPEVNGVETEDSTPEVDASDEIPAAETTTEPEAPPVPEQSHEPEPTPATKAPVEPASNSDAPPAKKTWASMLGTKAAASIPALPTTAASAPTQAKPSRSAQQSQPTPPAQVAQSPEPPAEDGNTAIQGNGWQTADHGKRAKGQQAKPSEGIVHAYIKNVNDKVDARVLRDVLAKFGELKYYDVSRPRNCAFVEFADPAGYAAAVAANPHTVGTEQISVEERRLRPGQYSSTNNNNSNAQFNRSGSNTGRPRGNMQQRSGSQGANPPKEAGRGGFQQRGGKAGNVTPKGRGQAPAAS